MAIRKPRGTQDFARTDDTLAPLEAALTKRTTFAFRSHDIHKS